MKLKTSFFDFTVLKKDLTRFFPVWAIYLIGGLLISQTAISADSPNTAARYLSNILWPMAPVNCGYGAMIALLLFGDLFKSKMCNALHALPVRREGWFVTHVAAALLMSILPNLILAVLIMPLLGQFWFTALLWLLLMTLEFVFFFGLAVLCIQCVGNGLAAMLMYAICNFGVFLIMWVVATFAVPMLYGVELRGKPFIYLSPVVYFLANEPELWEVAHLSSCPCRGMNRIPYNFQHEYAFTGLGEGWGYLTIMVIAGVAALVAALLLYRRRKLESAGDFAAIKPTGWVFTIVGSVLAGMVFYLFGQGEAVLEYLLLAAGMLVGFFCCRMLLERKVKVFGKKNWLRLVALLLSFALFLGLAAADVLGIEKRIPEAEDVQSVTIAESYLSEYELEQIQEQEGMARGIDPSYMYGKDGKLTLRQPAQIQEIMEIHRLLMEEGDNRESGREYQVVTIHYILKNGTTLTRYYYAKTTGSAMTRLKQFTGTPEYILGVSSPEELGKYLDTLYLYAVTGKSYDVTQKEWLEKFCQAIYKDAENGTLDWSYSSQLVYSIELRYVDPEGMHRYLDLWIEKWAQNTCQCIQEYLNWVNANQA